MQKSLDLIFWERNKISSGKDSIELFKRYLLNVILLVKEKHSV